MDQAHFGLKQHLGGSGTRTPGIFTACVFAACLICLTAGCSGTAILFGLPPAPDDAPGSVDLAVAVVQPAAPTTTALGIETVIQWADIAQVAGTTVRVTAQRKNDTNEDIGDPIELIGDGTPGSGRDALADGESDVFVWDITGVRAGDYVITVVIESPDGQSASALSRDEERGTDGVIRIVTALPVPTLTFTAPGDADETIPAGGDFTITWTDDGAANADALLQLALDSDADHESGNEIVLFRDDPLSAGGNDGLFLFARLDENGDAVPAGTYTLFATIDDGANDIVTVEAVGRLILDP